MIKQVQIPSTRLSSETTIATKSRHSCPRVRNPFSALARNLSLGSDGEVAVLARETQRHHFPFITQNISPSPTATWASGPNWFRNKSDSWFAFEWGPGARLYIIGLDYVGSDINRAPSGATPSKGYFVLTDFLLLRFVHILSSLGMTHFTVQERLRGNTEDIYCIMSSTRWIKAIKTKESNRSMESPPWLASEEGRKYFSEEIQASGTYRQHCRRQSLEFVRIFGKFLAMDRSPQSSLIAQIWWLWQGMNIRLYIISRVINSRRSDFSLQITLHCRYHLSKGVDLSQIWFWQLFIHPTAKSASFSIFLCSSSKEA